MTLALVMATSWAAWGQIGVSALSLDVNLAPGGSFAGNFEVFNNGQQPRQFTVEVKDYDRTIDGGLVLLTSSTHPRSLAKFFTVAPVAFTLSPGQKQLIGLNIKIPANESGPHWVALVISSPIPKVIAMSTDQPQSPVTIGSEEQFIIKIRQTDPTNAVNKGRITGTSVILPEKDKHLQIVVEYENSGTTFQQPKAQLRIVNAKGEIVLQKDIADLAVLPGGKLRLKIPVTQTLPVGPYLALVIIDFGGDALVAGQVRFQL
ncbi:hypothetical protein HY009_06195 [Candidatus Acetothermia bacterium]|nr:hypothetical protein [Candidatus Acetothermia bacterium]